MRCFVGIGAVAVVAMALAASAFGATLSGTVSGQFPGESPRPLAGATVSVLNPETEEAVGSSFTDAQGEYSVGAPSGSFDVRFAPGPSDQFEPATIHGVDLSADRSLDVTLAASTADFVHFSGHLLAAEGTPAPRAKVWLLNPDGTMASGTESESDGSFSMLVPPGSYDLQAHAFFSQEPNLPKNWTVHFDTVDLQSDEARDLRLPATSQLTVEVLDEEGAPIGGAGVSLPVLLGATEMEALGFSSVTASPANAATDAAGRAGIVVFDGGMPASGALGRVVAPPSSGYGEANFSVPTIEGGATVVVSFQRAEFDNEPPLLVLTETPSAEGGWVDDDPVDVLAIGTDPSIVALSCSVDEIGIEAEPTKGTGSLELAVQVAGGGEHQVECIASDSFGNSTQQEISVRIDLAPPMSSLVCPSEVVLGASATAAWADSDDESGLVGPASGSIELGTNTVGRHEITHIAADGVGHTTSSSCSYLVVYPFAFAGGIKLPPALNQRKKGEQTMDVRFDLGGNRGLAIFQSDFPNVQRIDCLTGTPIGASIPASQRSPLQYQKKQGTYVYSWDLRSLGKGGCVALRVGLNDETTHEFWLQL